jgi:hypothetical protein
LAGRRRHGKTTLVINLGIALSLSCQEFLGFSIPNPRRCIAFLLEDDATEIQATLRKVLDAGTTEGRFKLVCKSDFLASKIPIDVADPGFRSAVANACNEHKPDAIFLDNASMLLGGDNNNPTKTHTMTQFSWGLANQFNSSVVVAAHPRKRSDWTRKLKDDPEGFFEEVMGSSHFVNSFGSLWGIERDDLNNNKAYFVGGAQRLSGTQSLMVLEKDDSGWLRVGSDVVENFDVVMSTEKRKEAWRQKPHSNTLKPSRL